MGLKLDQGGQAEAFGSSAAPLIASRTGYTIVNVPSSGGFLLVGGDHPKDQSPAVLVKHSSLHSLTAEALDDLAPDQADLLRRTGAASATPTPQKAYIFGGKLGSSLNFHDKIN